MIRVIAIGVVHRWRVSLPMPSEVVDHEPVLFFPSCASVALARSSHNVVLMNELSRYISYVPPWGVESGVRTDHEPVLVWKGRQGFILADSPARSTGASAVSVSDIVRVTLVSVSLFPQQCWHEPLAWCFFFFDGAICLSAGHQTWGLLADQRGIEPPPAVCPRHKSAAIPTGPRGHLWASSLMRGYRGSFGLCSAFCGLVHWWNCIVWSRALASGRRLGWLGRCQLEHLLL